MPSTLRTIITSALLTLTTNGLVSASETALAGHLKYQFTGLRWAEESAGYFLTGDTTHLHSADLRLNLNWHQGPWQISSAYQLQHLASDDEIIAAPDDDRRLFDFSASISSEDTRASLHRLDRLHLSYAQGNSVLRIGRQAISWGNGLFYNPVDVFNPFDPVAIDKEYKSGDDMIYAQQLFANGNDLQGVWVGRRDSSGKHRRAVDSLALKYHGFAGEREYDILLAEHYDSRLLGLGGTTALGDALWRTDLVWTVDDDAKALQLVSNLAYSWRWHDRNLSGVLEYYYNGFANKDEALNTRIDRGEIFSRHQHNLAASLTIEMTPLLNLSPTLLYSPEEQSGLFQVIANYNLAENAQLILALNLAISPTPASPEQSVFAQLAWYF